MVQLVNHAVKCCARRALLSLSNSCHVDECAASQECNFGLACLQAPVTRVLDVRLSHCPSVLLDAVKIHGGYVQNLKLLERFGQSYFKGVNFLAAFSMIPLPESPYWLIERGRNEDARYDKKL